MGRPPSLYSFPSIDELAPSLRRFVLDAQNEAVKRQRTFRVAVSGGSLPKTLAKALFNVQSNGFDDDKVRFDQWEIFYADERCVPLTDDDSNHKLINDEVLSRIPEGSPKPKTYPINEAYLDDPQEMADDYEKTLVSVFAARDSVRMPHFDLILLGCGPDGHTCSLFPDHELLREKDAWVLSLDNAPKPPPKRITLSLPVVVHAAKIGFVATGEGKREVLRKIFETDQGRELPCGLVNEQAGGSVSWFCDDAAADTIRFPRRPSIV
ncbi:6-phosphogluconolactonase [Piedraia hortae CBS 480.64]|uniref:6-phosphogluconolactonase n=1 Tax=Piedraia hortae CBS 480.64 TaxID=1314780 RepID=A0A6A7BRM5_9PEZI|nr:6-phosphogluconolactonase [Piedraia hortae CBS 480.64]